MSSKNFENDSFSKRVVEKVAEYQDSLHQDEVSAWKQIFLDLSSEWELNCSDLRWQDLSKYYKRSLVFKLSHRRLTNDQALIDRLQYPYLRKVYSITIKLYEKYQSEGEYGRSGNNSEIEDNKLFIKYSMDGRYDPDVVAAFKRRSRKGKRIYVNINVANPAYNLPEDVKKLLLQIEHNRREPPQRHVEAKKDVREKSPVVLDGVAVAIEDGSPPQVMEFSARDLLEKESFSVNTQEYDKIIKESLERELSPVPKRRRVESFEPHCIEIWLESNEILSTSSTSVAQGDPLHMSGQSATNLLDMSKSVAIDNSVTEPSFTPTSGEIAMSSKSHQRLESVRSQPPTLIMASQQNGTLSAVQADSSCEMIRIKQEPIEVMEAGKPVGNSVLCCSKSSGLSMDVASEESFITIASLAPRSVRNESTGHGSSPVVKSPNSIQSKQDAGEKESFEETVLPPDFFRDHSTSSEKESADVEVIDNTSFLAVESTRVDNESIISNINCSSKSIYPESTAEESQEPIPVRLEQTETEVVVQSQQSVLVKQEVAEVDIPNFDECVLPSDFFCDHSSSGEIELTRPDYESLTPPRGPSNTKSTGQGSSVIVQSQQSVQIKLERPENGCMVVETPELPADFFMNGTSESVLCNEVEPKNGAKEATDPRHAAEFPTDYIGSRMSSTSDNSSNLTVVENEDVTETTGTTESTASHCIQPAGNQLTRKRLSLLNDNVSGISLLENSLESVPLHCIMKNRQRLRTLLVDQQNVLLPDAAGSINDVEALDMHLSNHHQSVCASESLDLSGDVDSVASTNDISDQLLQPVTNLFQNNSTDTIDQHLMQRFDISLHLESQSQHNQIYMSDLQNNNLPSTSVVKNEPCSANPSHATVSDRGLNSSRQVVSDAILVHQESPPKASTNFQRRHESLQPTIDSRLRFQVVLRSCWPELFSKTGTFSDFYELMSILAVNLFPHLRPADPIQILALWPMFSALASQIAFGIYLQGSLEQSTQTVGGAVQLTGSSGGRHHSDEYYGGVDDRQINGDTAEIEEDLPQKVARREKDCRKRFSEEIIIEISDDSDPEDLPVRRKRQFRVRRHCPQNSQAKLVCTSSLHDERANEPRYSTTV